MASGKKTFARRDALRSCPETGWLPPDVPVPCARKSRTRSADRVRQVTASIRGPGFTGPVLSAGRQAGRGVNRRSGMSGLHGRS